MHNEIIINAAAGETRVAILERSTFTELLIERQAERNVMGNVVKGLVTRVLPGMQAAFVNLGLERDGFLYVSDVINPVASMDGIDASEADVDGETAPEDVSAGNSPSSGDRSGSGRSRGRDRNQSDQPIDKLLTAGQELSLIHI